MGGGDGTEYSIPHRMETRPWRVSRGAVAGTRAGRGGCRCGRETPPRGPTEGRGRIHPWPPPKRSFETCTHLKEATSRCGRWGSPHLSASIRARTKCHHQRSEGIQELGVIGVPRLESSEIKRRHRGPMLTPVHRSRFHVGVEKGVKKGCSGGGPEKCTKMTSPIRQSGEFTTSVFHEIRAFWLHF